MSIIFWDYDGTLAWSEHLWSISVHRALLETDPASPVTFHQIWECMEYGFTWHTPERDYTAFKGEKWWDFMNRHFYESYLKCGVSEETARAAAAAVRGVIKRLENYHLYEDTIEVLEAMKAAGHANIILSNNYPDLEDVLNGLGLMKYFDGRVVSAVEGYDKPRPELFTIARQRFPGDDCWMIGDNPRADVLGGKAAGMKTILVHKGFSENADYCFDNLRGICGVLA